MRLREGLRPRRCSGSPGGSSLVFAEGFAAQGGAIRGQLPGVSSSSAARAVRGTELKGPIACRNRLYRETGTYAGRSGSGLFPAGLCVHDLIKGLFSTIAVWARIPQARRRICKWAERSSGPAIRISLSFGPATARSRLMISLSGPVAGACTRFRWSMPLADGIGPGFVVFQGRGDPARPSA